jgi:osmotically-inducible protein OsmY
MNFFSQNTVSAALFATLLLSGGALAGAQDSTQTTTPADNTKINQRDRNAAEPTADQQKMNPGDRETTKQIRQAITKDKSISTYGHNVKIISQNGMVTLKGPVRSEEEKQAIEAKAKEIAGPDKVTDELEVKSKQ